MNPWTKTECQRLADALDLEDQDEWLRRFNLVGGKPRFLFSSGYFDEMVLRVVNAVPNTVDGIKQMIRQLDDEERMKHIILHMYRKENAPDAFYWAYTFLAVETIVRSRFSIQSAGEIYSLLKISANDLQSWREKEIERVMLQDLASRETSVRPLESINESSSSSALTLLGPFGATLKFIKASSEIEKELMLYITLSKTFPAVDAVLVVPSQRLVIYAQATVSKTYPIKYQPLGDIYKDLAGRQTKVVDPKATKSAVNEFLGYTHILLFIVSGDIYDDFRIQPLQNVDGERRGEIGVTQYVGQSGRSNRVHVISQ